MRVLIVSGGSINRDFALDFLKKNKQDYVIAVDKGAYFCYEAGIRPDVLAGDFDTLPAEILQKFERSKVPVRKFRPEKDFTDIEIALEMAKERIRTMKACGVSNESVNLVTILGGTGTRLDHMLGTIYCMVGFGPEIPCQLVDEYNRLRILWPGIHVLRKSESYGPFISLLPIGGCAEGIDLRGFKYPLTEASMSCYNSLGVSNELVEEEGRITFREGVLACFETRD